MASAALAGIAELMDMSAQLQRRIEELEARPMYTDASHCASQPHAGGGMGVGHAVQLACAFHA